MEESNLNEAQRLLIQLVQVIYMMEVGTVSLRPRLDALTQFVLQNLMLPLYYINVLMDRYFMLT